MPAAPPPKPDVAQEADDLADLDDVLDDFDAPTSSAAGAATSSPPAAPSTGSASGSAAPPGMPNFDSLLDGTEGDADVDELLSGDFAKELAAGMEALMRELGGASGAGTGAAAGGAPPMGPVPPPAAGGDAEVNEEEMMRQFEAMMKDMGLAGAGGMPGGEAGPSAPAASGAASTSGAAAPPANFQDAIKATMERLKNSDSSAAASAGGAGGFGDADLEKLMAALGGGGAGGEGGDEDLAKMLENMMGELMSKEVLYEPLKELRDKYPPYLSSPAAANLSADDRVRYQEQARVVGQIVATFDERDFDHGSEARKRELKNRVQELMNEMQDNGAPPPEIAGEMPSELAGLPGMNGDDENCSVM
ncbi:Pex19-domain-containing protein [Tilletiopsis washingtonensis]|uniref:Pex19-domain-containing protein n=1 Tax=Tilletiopsis washingtonensis TaxID=58919 RepID=A0A316ZHD7_9BASI|nr:Pex19-domain-containing protein [Tilletiopsis washingtonensis]PWO00932.1 Pex19-domain-containing protein [Tilletiopsis washingtonensis]